MSKRTVYAALHELEALGIVTIEHGTRWDIELKSGHPLTGVIRQAIDIDEGATALFVTSRLPKEGVERIVWFGSTSTGKSLPRSDLDLIVVSRKGKYRTLKMMLGTVRPLERLLHREIHIEIAHPDRPGGLEEHLTHGKVLFDESLPRSGPDVPR